MEDKKLEETLNKIITNIKNEFEEKIKQGGKMKNKLAEKLIKTLDKRAIKHCGNFKSELEKHCEFKVENEEINIIPHEGKEEEFQESLHNYQSCYSPIKSLIDDVLENMNVTAILTEYSLNNCIGDAAQNFSKDKNQEFLENHLYNCFEHTVDYNIPTENEIDAAVYKSLKTNLKEMY